VIDLDSPVETVLGEPKDKRSRTRNERIVEGLGLETVGDLLHHFPRRYVETGELTSLETLEKGQFLTLVGEIASSRVNTYTDRRTRRTAYRLDATLRTDGPSLRMSFFAKNKGVADWQAGRLRGGRRGIFLGQADTFRGEWQLTNPQMVLFGSPEEDSAQLSLESIGAFYPIYPLTKGVESWDLQRAISFARAVVERVPEPLPEAVRRQYDVLEARQALDWIHAPDSWGQITRAQHRYRFEEALVTQLVLGRRRRALRAMGARPRVGGDGELLAAFDAGLPFELTRGQREVGTQIDHDLAQPHPMNRLLQGEVGSGKTLVALRAMLRVVDSGGQAALLAPTEVLASQHARNIRELLGPLGRAGELDGDPDATRVTLLTGSLGAAARRQALGEVSSGAAGIVVGTHALLYEGVDFADLGLIVVDEQHRFGVEQRDALRAKAGQPPHVLVMTATPIPRTVAMTVFGDLETSTLSQLPKGRSPIASHVVPAAEKPAFLERAWRRIREEVAAGHQAYVVCPRIGDTDNEVGEADDGKRPPVAVLDIAPLLEQGPLYDLKIKMLHGRLPADEKEATMRAFAAGAIDVLVATTVIEVGVDVPNATVMAVLDADRFGVSQLHQLRGRVGRGSAPGLCLLVTESLEGTPARERLDAVASTTDGFKLAELDLEQRREGDVLGTSQSGRQKSLRLLSLLKDEDLIRDARLEAIELIDEDPDLTKHPALAAAVAHFVDDEQAEYLEKG
jgi:ATP-dependent DNA helicase RecG